jgi:hypothetical protein
LTLQDTLRAEVTELLALGEQADQQARPDGLDVAEEILLRRGRLTPLEKAQAILEARAKEREVTEQAAYEAKVLDRAAKAQETGRQPGGHAPEPPTPGPRTTDQYNFTDPESRIMKNSHNAGFDQHYNVQVAVDQDTLLIVSNTLSNHPNDKGEALPTVDAIPSELGTPTAGALDNGYFSPKNIDGFGDRDIDAYIATGREPHHQSWQERFAEQPTPPPADASPIVKMAYKLQTDIGKAIYRLRKCTVEPVTGALHRMCRHHQGSTGLPPVLVAWFGGRRWRVGIGLLGLQSQTTARVDGRLTQGPFQRVWTQKKRIATDKTR